MKILQIHYSIFNTLARLMHSETWSDSPVFARISTWPSYTITVHTGEYSTNNHPDELTDIATKLRVVRSAFSEPSSSSSNKPSSLMLRRIGWKTETSFASLPKFKPIPKLRYESNSFFLPEIPAIRCVNRSMYTIVLTVHMAYKLLRFQNSVRL